MKRYIISAAAVILAALSAVSCNSNKNTQTKPLSIHKKQHHNQPANNQLNSRPHKNHSLELHQFQTKN